MKLKQQLNRLYDEFAADLYRFALVMTGRKHDAEDVIQNVFLRLAKQPDSLKTMKNPKAYLFAAARNESITLIKTRSRKQEKEIDLSRVPYLTKKEDCGESPVDALQLSQALQQLPASQREIIALHSFENLTFRDIAEILNLPQNTVSSRYRLGLEKLRRIFGALL